MSAHKTQTKFIDMLEANELLIAELYRSFALHFEDHAAFWNEMAHDENSHASMIRALEGQLRDGSVRIAEDRFDLTSFQMFHDYVRTLLHHTQTHVISLEKAFETAVAVEHDMIERRFFDVFATDSVELKLILEGLASSTKAHLKKLIHALENYQKPVA